MSKIIQKIVKGIEKFPKNILLSKNDNEIFSNIKFLLMDNAIIRIIISKIIFLYGLSFFLSS